MKSSVLRVPGFRAAGVHCGIKNEGLDLALLVSDRPAAAAGLFTRSSVVGAPVELSRAHLRSGSARGIVANSGISNVAMGARGRRDAAEMARCAVFFKAIRYVHGLYSYALIAFSINTLRGSAE